MVVIVFVSLKIESFLYCVISKLRNIDSIGYREIEERCQKENTQEVVNR